MTTPSPNPIDDSSAAELPSPRFRSKAAGWVQLAAYLVGLGITAPVEWSRFSEVRDQGRSLGWWFVDMNVDTTPFFVLLVLAPFFWLIRRTPSHDRGVFARSSGLKRAWGLSLLVGVTALFVSVGVAWTNLGGPQNQRFGELPPAYHDEYSYLFQAETFLAGRVTFPQHAATPELFDQMHVLNDDGRFASRYFPGTGAWIAVFQAFGQPNWGHWLANALTAMLIFWAGRELAGDLAGFVAGILTALSPGMALFSNLLLSHHPTLVGLALFVWAFLRMMRTWQGTDALLAGTGLAFAMLCRPMTAAGVGLPFGLWFFWWICRGGAWDAEHRLRFRLRTAIVLSVPLIAGLAVLFWYNRAVTGSGWTTPYQLYTEIYTPRHVYGFNNRVWGEQHLGPKVLDNYDRWAENLTPALAAENVEKRLIAGWQWTLGIVPLAMAGVVFVLAASWRLPRSWLVAAAIVSLHAVHVPYWFSGIMNWHYVFESGPLWLLLFAVSTQWLLAQWRTSGRRGMRLWWVFLVLASLAVSYTSPEPFWGISRLNTGIQEVGFSRLKYEAFNRLIEERIPVGEALVLIDADPADRHIDYVVNDPALNNRVLRGRFRPGQTDVSRVFRAFPEREIYLYRERSGRRQVVRLQRPPVQRNP